MLFAGAAGGVGGRALLWVLEGVLHVLEAVEGARGRRRCALYAEVARLAKRFFPGSHPSYVSGRYLPATSDNRCRCPLQRLDISQEIIYMRSLAKRIHASLKWRDSMHQADLSSR